MTNENTKKLVPKLRFSEFENYEEWKVKKLGNFTCPVKDRVGLKKYILMSVTAGVGLIPQIEKFGREIAGNSYKNYYVIKRNDFAYNKSATKQYSEGYIAMLKDYDAAALPNSIFTCFRLINDKYSPTFFNQLFYLNYHGAWLRKFISVGARAHGSLNIDSKYLWNMPVAIPRLEEQQKIADCLTSLDELIELEGNKLDELKEHKKGLLQKLFPQEGKTIPELRFAEFKNDKEWEEKEISSVGEIITGKTPSTNNYDLWKGDILFVTPTDITENKYQKNTCRKVVKTKNMKILPKGSIMFTCIASIGKMAMSVYPSITNQQINAVIPFENYVNEYIYYSILKKSVSIKALLANTTLPIINKTEFSKIKIFASQNKGEQQKIADCLCSLDDLITAQAEKVDALKEHKKGLMQGLFPTLEEVCE